MSPDERAAYRRRAMMSLKLNPLFARVLHGPHRKLYLDWMVGWLEADDNGSPTPEMPETLKRMLAPSLARVLADYRAAAVDGGQDESGDPDQNQQFRTEREMETDLADLVQEEQDET